MVVGGFRWFHVLVLTTEKGPNTVFCFYQAGLLYVIRFL